MRFKSRLLLLLSTIALTNTALAITCPALSDIQTLGISNAQEVKPDSYVAFELSQYNTGFDWAFMIGLFENVTQAQAITDANLVLGAMVAPGVPVLENGRVICRYDTGQPHKYALAVRDIYQISPDSYKGF